MNRFGVRFHTNSNNGRTYLMIPEKKINLFGEMVHTNEQIFRGIIKNEDGTTDFILAYKNVKSVVQHLINLKYRKPKKGFPKFSERSNSFMVTFSMPTSQGAIADCDIDDQNIHLTGYGVRITLPKGAFVSPDSEPNHALNTETSGTPTLEQAEAMIKAGQAIKDYYEMKEQLEAKGQNLAKLLKEANING